MDTSTEDFTRSDVDAEMTMLTPDDVAGQSADVGDEVENLRNSLREVVHDDTVQPKMQCLMMDSSFSMVTMQGEDSGIAWETTSSRCTTPWASDAGAAELGSPVAVRPATPKSHPAGKIIFVMDEEVISRQRKTKENKQKSKAEKQQQALGESFENISGRPELVEVSRPNVKSEVEGDQEEAADPLEDKEQRLFSIVSEGSEILNIVVPPKFATVDEEESKEMVDNLSYLEESLVPRATVDIQDNELLVLPGPGDQAQAPPVPAPAAMDPPGAPVARPAGRAAAGNVDYFEAFALVDAQAPGSPAVTAQEQEQPKEEAATESQETEELAAEEESVVNKKVDNDRSDTGALEEITSELLDEVFYGGTDSHPIKSLGSADGGTAPISRLPSKPSGSNLFGSQEEILTPIYLPEGPPKIIDPILLEEPKAMAFLYTDLYEEAVGSWKKEEDAESMTSEKSFHSRHSDREARGYLEKYVLIDETPAVEVEQAEKENQPEEESRTLLQDLYEDFQVKSDKDDKQQSEEITDFFRSSGNSSPCDIDPFPRSQEEEEDTQTKTKSKAKKQKSVSIVAEKAAESPADPLSLTSFEFPPEEPDWLALDDPIDLEETHVNVHAGEEIWKQDPELNKPVAPPRKKAASSPKSCLDLTPLTPADGTPQEEEMAGGKEQKVEEEKETASPAETADEGDGEDIAQAPAEEPLPDNAPAPGGPGSSESQQEPECEEAPARDSKPAEERDMKTAEEGGGEMEAAPQQIELKDTEVTKEMNPEKQEDSPAAPSEPAEPAKNKSQCIIL
ncbi:uncharacterized protein ACNS7B_014313 [Menidia menidia]